MTEHSTGELAGKVAIVTGAGAGLGNVFARALAAEGALIAVADVDLESAQSLATELTDNGTRSIAVKVDTTDDAAVAAMVDTVVAELGGIDILVNNAGWRPIPAGHLYDDFNDELGAKEWTRVLQVNVVGPVICGRACRPAMVARGGGVIVNLSSQAAYTTGAGPYGVSKLALNGVTMTQAIEYADDGIRVNGIAPGSVSGRLASPAVVEHIVQGQLIKRRGAPDDLVGTLLFLCSERSAFITGQTILVDGGTVLRI
jgi:3-oxoacyl-[acyl-carrier protein] reductase